MHNSYDLKELLSDGYINQKHLNRENITPFSLSLFLANPPFHAKVFKNITTDKKNNQSLYESLQKYLLRAAFRATPNGLWAGVSTAVFSKKTSFIPKNPDHHKVLVRPNYGTLASVLFSNTPTDNYKFLMTNQTLRKVMNKYRYINPVFDSADIHYELAEAELTGEMEMLLNKFLKKIPVETIINDSITGNYPKEEVISDIREMIHNNLLFLPFLPLTNSTEYTQKTSEFNSPHNKQLKHLYKLLLNTTIHDLITHIDHLKRSYYFFNPGLDQKKPPWHIDLLITTEEASIHDKHRKKLKTVLNFLSERVATRPPKDLQAFSDLFLQQYHHESVPILEVFDLESGLPYGNISPEITNPLPLLNGYPYQPSIPPDEPISSFRTTILKRIYETIAAKKTSFEIDEQHFPKIQKPLQHETTLGHILCKLQRTDDFEMLTLHSWSNTGANALCGRFGYLSEEIKKWLTSFAKLEEKLNPDKIFAEISYLPENKTGNICFHPPYYNYQIAIPAGRNSDVQTIPLSKIAIQHDGKRLRIFSEQHKKEIIPRMSNAYNYSRSPWSLFRFLADMQYSKENQGLFFKWEWAENNLPFIPEITCKGITISPAVWNFSPGNIKAPIEQLDKDFKMFCKQYQVPTCFLTETKSREIFIDTSFTNLYQMFLKEVQKNGSAKLRAFSPLHAKKPVDPWKTETFEFVAFTKSLAYE